MQWQPALAADAPSASLNPQLEARMMAMAAELRCLVCQNQTIADSNADLAKDLRREVRGMLEAETERPVEIEEFAGGWMRLPATEQTRMQLGRGQRRLGLLNLIADLSFLEAQRRRALLQALRLPATRTEASAAQAPISHSPGHPAACDMPSLPESSLFRAISVTAPAPLTSPSGCTCS